MYIVVSGELLNELKNMPTRVAEGELWGTTHDQSTVGQVIASRPRPGLIRLGRWLRNDEPGSWSPVPPTSLKGGRLWLILNRGGQANLYQVQGRRPTAYRLQPLDYELMQPSQDYYSRVAGLFDPQHLHNKTVVVVGLGTGGALIALELARAGVGNFRLVDFDRLKAHNIVRHICGFDDIGRYKTEAVRSYLKRTSQVERAETYNFDVTKDPARLEQILTGADLLIGATDSEAAKGLLNRLAWPLILPAVYGAAYELGFGGDVFLADPPDQACYECFRRATANLFSNTDNRAEVEDYGTLVAGRSIFQPALGLDVRFVSLIAARTALTYLLGGDPQSRLSGFPANWVLWGNQVQPGWIFDRPLQSEFVQIESDQLCPVCHTIAYSQAVIGLSVEEARQKVAGLLAELPALPVDLIE